MSNKSLERLTHPGKCNCQAGFPADWSDKNVDALLSHKAAVLHVGDLCQVVKWGACDIGLSR